MTYVVVNTSKKNATVTRNQQMQLQCLQAAANLNLYQASLQHEMEVV